MKAVAVIPARGGSRRVPRKNLLKVTSETMVGNAIRAAVESECFDEVVVTTDDDEIEAEALRYDVSIVRRADHLSDHDVSAVAPVIDAAKQRYADLVAMILPDYPFTTADLIRRAMKLHTSSRASIVTARPIETRRLKGVDVERDVPHVWESCGAVQISLASTLYATRSFHSFAMYMPVNHWEAIEVDTREDLAFARALA